MKGKLENRKEEKQVMKEEAETWKVGEEEKEEDKYE